MGFNVVYVEAEPNSEDNIIEALDNYFGTKKFKPGGAVVLERLWIGGPKDMTHRLVFLWELGNQGFEEGELNLNSIKRPVSAVADNIEVRNAKNITVKTNKKIKFNLLYNSNSSLEKKIKLEQIKKEIK